VPRGRGPAQAASLARASGRPGAGAVYTMTNSADGNAIEAYARAGDGSLTPDGTYPTGGDGGTLGCGHHPAGPAPDRHGQLSLRPRDAGDGLSRIPRA
jgi:6-phosphogluconolactonase